MLKKLCLPLLLLTTTAHAMTRQQEQLALIDEPVVKAFLKEQNIDLEASWRALWQSFFTSHDWNKQDFYMTQRVELPRPFYQKLELIEQSILALFAKLAQANRELTYSLRDIRAFLRAISPNAQNDTIQHASITKILQAGDKCSFPCSRTVHTGIDTYQCSSRQGDAVMGAIGKAIAVYFERNYFNKRYVRQDNVMLVPFTPLMVIEQDGVLSIISAPGLLQEEIALENDANHAHKLAVLRHIAHAESSIFEKHLFCKQLLALFFIIACSFALRVLPWQVLKPLSSEDEFCAIAGTYCNKTPCHKVLKISLFSAKLADAHEIKVRSRDLAKELHPDKNNDPQATDQFIALQRCTKSLLDQFQDSVG